MKRLNQSQLALLGLLSFGAMSGYDLKQLSDWSVGYFWRESYGQIYPHLKRLEADGLVARKTERGTGRRDRHEYRLTAAGKQTLQRWLAKPAAEEIPRNEMLLKVFFGDLVAPEFTVEHIARQKAQSEAELTAYAAVQKRIEGEQGSPRQKQHWLMTLRYGIHIAQAQMNWCEEMLKELK
ncbi:PadR family transcriptional regulator [Paracidobacterium acidisoli]|uniref:PadR family transcriptional regulator n=1 Tax=Paracidobacterium acidisoli TaxID=2303751 RepID=A0A372IRH6_9BACT|nr:PadR family transcriptional regulator [Paracidobacterium acidisoli]MBT9330242.1 PadR family transcriptional regulator [Paracidobacterium acidisoli]